MVKRKITITAVATVILSALLTACGGHEFGGTENTGKRMTITAERADKESFFMVGTLEVDEEEHVVITSNLTEGSIRIELVGVPEEQNINEVPSTDGEVIVTADVTGTEEKTEKASAGSYMLRATCLERATGTVQIEVQADVADDSFTGPPSYDDYDDVISSLNEGQGYAYVTLTGSDEQVLLVANELFDGNKAVSAEAYMMMENDSQEFSAEDLGVVAGIDEVHPIRYADGVLYTGDGEIYESLFLSTDGFSLIPKDYLHYDASTQTATGFMRETNDFDSTTEVTLSKDQYEELILKRDSLPVVEFTEK